jgi:Raf kinase inhibitor-like YbhB/YbcL family protein
VPANAKSLALIVDDPDAPDPAAPRMTWVHWVLYNIPVAASGLPEGVVSSALPKGALEGLNDWQRTGYGGPCPPIGRHRYFHKLYALDVVLPDLKKPTKAALEKAMKGHVIAETQLIGTYEKGALGRVVTLQLRCDAQHDRGTRGEGWRARGYRGGGLKTGKVS